MNTPKPYEKPAVIESHSLEVKAVVCNQSDSAACSTLSS